MFRRTSCLLLCALILTIHAASHAYMWCGGVQATSAEFRVKSPVSGTFQVSTTATFGTVVFSQSVQSGVIAALSVGSLSPDTSYHYRVSTLTGDVGTFRTFPTPGSAASFRVSFASCADSGSDSTVFDKIVASKPLFFMHMGDLHYDDIEVNSTATYSGAYERVQDAARQRAFFRSFPIAYVFDDHDFGPNNSDGPSTPGRIAAQTTYQSHTAHYPLGAGSGPVPIYQAFTVGRVRFILTDLRSASAMPASPTSTMGLPQREWFRQQLEQAGNYRLVVWVNTKPWIGAPEPAEEDKWFAGRFEAERTILADMMVAANVTNLVSIAGDAHMLGVDDGSHSDYSTSGGAGFPIFQAAPMDRVGSTKGGPLTECCWGYRRWQTHNFGVMDVEDSAASTCLTWRAMAEGEEVLTWRQCAPFTRRGSRGGSTSGSGSVMDVFPPFMWATCLVGTVAMSAAAGLLAVVLTRRSMEPAPESATHDKETPPQNDEGVEVMNLVHGSTSTSSRSEPSGGSGMATDIVARAARDAAVDASKDTGTRGTALAHSNALSSSFRRKVHKNVSDRTNPLVDT